MWSRKKLSNEIKVFKKHAYIYSCVAEGLALRLEPMDLGAVAKVLELSAKVGHVYEFLKQRLKNSQYVLQEEDALFYEYLAMKYQKNWFFRSYPSIEKQTDGLAGPFQLCISSLNLNRTNLSSYFKNLHHKIDHKGLIVMSCFGIDTLKELSGSSEGRDASPYLDVHEVGDELIKQGFENPVLDVDHYRLQYSSQDEMLQELYSIGLMTEQQVKEWMCSKNKLPLEIGFEVIYAHAFKGKQQKVGDDVFVSIDTIRKNR